MAKITSKLQVTIPKVVAERYGLRPGSHIEFQVAGEGIRVVPEGRPVPPDSTAVRLRLFDHATDRQRARERKRSARSGRSRGWQRNDLHDRGVPPRH